MPNVKAYDNKTDLLKSVLKTVMDPPGGLNLDIKLYGNLFGFLTVDSAIC